MLNVQRQEESSPVLELQGSYHDLSYIPELRGIGLLGKTARADSLWEAVGCGIKQRHVGSIGALISTADGRNPALPIIRIIP